MKKRRTRIILSWVDGYTVRYEEQFCPICDEATEVRYRMGAWNVECRWCGFYRRANSVDFEILT